MADGNVITDKSGGSHDLSGTAVSLWANAYEDIHSVSATARALSLPQGASGTRIRAIVYEQKTFVKVALADVDSRPSWSRVSAAVSVGNRGTSPLTSHTKAQRHKGTVILILWGYLPAHSSYKGTVIRILDDGQSYKILKRPVRLENAQRVLQQRP